MHVIGRDRIPLYVLMCLVMSLCFFFVFVDVFICFYIFGTMCNLGKHLLSFTFKYFKEISDLIYRAFDYWENYRKSTGMDAT